MPTVVQCPNPDCGKSYSIADEQLGRKCRCRHCGENFLLVPPTLHKSQAAFNSPSDTNASGTTCHSGPSATKAPGERGTARRLGRFEIREKLGAGAFGAVYRAFDPQLERDVALKVPQAATLESSKAVERFLREAKAAAQLRHPHIVPVYDAGRDGEDYYIASAFVEGRTLEAAIEEHEDNGASFCFRAAAEIVRKLAEAVDYAHGLGIVHRDVKPANVMLDTRGEPHLLDFGLARLDASQDKLTHDGAVVGTPAYMSPEQAKGHHLQVGPASDQYSLGVVLYELLTGKTPFSGPPAVVIVNILNQPIPSPRSLNPRVPRDLETICLKALARDAESRFSSCSELAADLQRWLHDQPILARRTGPVERLVRWCKREPLTAALVGAVAASVITVAAVASISAVKLALAAEREAGARAEAVANAVTAQEAAERAEQSAATAQAEAARAEAEAENARRANQQFEEEARRALEAQSTAEASAVKALEAEELARLEAQNATEARDRATAETQRVRRLLYVSDVNLAQQALEAGNTPRAQELLEAHVPRSNDPDLRRIEWHYLWRIAQPGWTLWKTLDGDHRQACFSQDGRLLMLVSSTDDEAMPGSKLSFWDMTTGRLARQLLRSSNLQEFLEIAPDVIAVTAHGELIGQGSGAYWKWNVRGAPPGFIDPILDKDVTLVSPTGRLTAMEGIRGRRHGVTIAGRGAQVAVRAAGDQPETDRPSREALVGALLGGWFPIAFSPDETLIAVLGRPDAASPPTLIVSEVATGKELFRTEAPSGSTIDWSSVLGRCCHPSRPIPFQDLLSLRRGAIFSPDSRTLALGSQLVDARTGRVRAHLIDSRPIRDLAFLPGGRTLITVHDDGEVLEWEVRSGQSIGRILPGGTDASATLSFVDISPKVTQIVRGWTGGRALEIWRVDVTPARSNLFGSHRGAVSSVGVSHRGKGVTADAEGFVVLWDLSGDGAVMHRASLGSVAAVSPDGGRIATANPPQSQEAAGPLSDPHCIQLWDEGPPGPAVRLSGHADRVSSTAFSLDGRRLASGSWDGTVRLWDTASGEERLVLSHGARVHSVALSADGAIAVSGGADQTVRVWDLAGGVEQTILKGPGDEVTCVAVTADGRSVAASSLDGTVRIWNAATGQEQFILKDHQEPVTGVAFAPDGETLASSGRDATVRLWDVRTGRPKIVLKEASQPITSLAFSPGGQQILAGTEDRRLRLWRGNIGPHENDAAELADAPSPTSGSTVDGQP